MVWSHVGYEIEESFSAQPLYSQVFGLVKVGLREFSFGVTGSLEIGDLLGSPTGNEY